MYASSKRYSHIFCYVQNKKISGNGSHACGEFAWRRALIKRAATGEASATEALTQRDKSAHDDVQRIAANLRRRWSRCIEKIATSLPISCVFNVSIHVSNLSNFQFEENEKQRIKTELGKQDQKHQKRLDLLRQQNESTLKELEHLQNEKRKMLLENETQKLKLYDQEYHGDVQVWKSQLKPRKQVRTAASFISIVHIVIFQSYHFYQKYFKVLKTRSVSLNFVPPPQCALP